MGHIVAIDKRKDNSVLKEMRQQIGQVMKTQEFEEAVCGTLGYNTNLWAIAAVCNGQVNVSEPWVNRMSQYS